MIPNDRFVARNPNIVGNDYRVYLIRVVTPI